MRGEPPVTKFTPPRLPATLVDRPALIERLEVASAAPVTLVTGFAGAGKTVLLSAWLKAHPASRAAWMSCDSWDADTPRFWTSIITALRQIAPDVGRNALDSIDADPEETAELVASLVNDLASLLEPMALVIDDLHVVPRPATRGLTEFLERLPPQVRIVIGSRSDPLLPLHRWRVSNRLSELRDVDLRLQPHEVEAMLRAFDVELVPQDVETLWERTEGWAAGVQLAALSLRSRDDPSEFVQTFAGNQRGIADFLVGEILDRQAADVVEFLLVTSIVDDLDGELCDHLSGRSDGHDMLHAVEEQGLFVVPLDDERRRYRYHQLFRDLLRTRLQAAEPDRVSTLHRSAARWFHSRDDLTATLQHLIRGGALDEAFGILHDHLLESFFTPTRAQLSVWLDELPEQAVAEERDRMLDFALGLALNGHVDASGLWLQRARHAATITPPQNGAFGARLETACGLWRALRGEAEAAAASGRLALDLVSRGVDPTVDAAPLFLIPALVWLDDLDAARQTYEEAAGVWRDRITLVSLRGSASMIEYEAGNLRAASEHADAALLGAERTRVQEHPATIYGRLTVADLALERSDLHGAEQGYEQALRLSEFMRPPLALLALLGLARVWHARGEWQQAYAAIERARDLLPFDARSPLPHRATALEAEFALGEDDLARVDRLIATMPDGPLRALAEARRYLSMDDRDAARQCAQRLGSSRTLRRELESTLLLARVAAESGSDARPLLERGLSLGRSQHFLRTMVTIDPMVTKLLADLVARLPPDRYLDALAAAIDQLEACSIPEDLAVAGTLSERERDVLRLLPTRLTSKEIAGELFISVNTLKTHLKAIYRKLDASSRSDAVARARVQKRT